MAETPAEKPNILFVMADQLIPMLTGAYGHPVVQTPHLNQLAERGVRFEAAYSPCPVCGPARAALMTGLYISETRNWDNASELSSEIPTFAHHLRLAGYETCLSGKMHFVGADQLHGFEQRLTTDIYPADFEWTPSWEYGVTPNPRHRKPMATDYVTAGPVQWSMTYEYDEEAHFYALQFLRQRRTELQDEAQRPFFLCVSYQHPHEPFLAARELWDLYEGAEIEIPALPDDMEAHVHPMDYWLNTFHGVHLVELMNPTTLYNMRRAYYANVTYIDQKLGELIAALKACGLYDNTMIVFTSDHGDMLGERGMVQKRTFYEFSARIPLIASFPPNWPIGRDVSEPVSLLDLAPTFVELATGQLPAEMSGRSLVPLLEGRADGPEPRDVISESHGQGVQAPCFMLRHDKYKYIYVHDEAPQLYDLEADPGEWNNLAGQVAYASLEADLKNRILSRFDPEAIKARVLASQQQRLLVRQAAKIGRRTPWDYQPFFDAGQRFKR